MVRGDSHSASIAAASILAKVSRDRYMVQMAERYPQYRFEKHKGYPTKLHYQLLRQYGPVPSTAKPFLKSCERRGRCRRVGRWGEALAAEYLRRQGYKLLSSGYCCRMGEIDLIGVRDGILAFVEVKTRQNERFGQGREFVDQRKQGADSRRMPSSIWLEASLL